MREGVLATVRALGMELVKSTDLIFVDLTQQLTCRATYKTNSGVCFLVASTLLSESPVGSSVQGCLSSEVGLLNFITKTEVVQSLIPFRSS